MILRRTVSIPFSPFRMTTFFRTISLNSNKSVIILQLVLQIVFIKVTGAPLGVTYKLLGMVKSICYCYECLLTHIKKSTS